MRKIIFFLLPAILSITNFSCDTDETEVLMGSCDFIDFKYFNGTQDYLGELSNDYILIGVDSIYNDIEIQDFISTINQIDQSYTNKIYSNEQYKFKEIPLKFNSSKTCEEITQIISDLEGNPIVAYAHYTLQTENCDNAIWEPIGSLCVNSYGSNFYVKVFDENDLTNLNQMIAETNTELVNQNDFILKWFELRATKNSNGDALAMANFFYESELFEHSEPGISKYPVE